VVGGMRELLFFEWFMIHYVTLLGFLNDKSFKMFFFIGGSLMENLLMLAIPTNLSFAARKDLFLL
jgi:hypothetical protein